MNKTERLFALIDVFRRHRRAVTAAALAEEMGVSLRTIYRDVQTLIGLGAPIDGEAGTGYLLRPGFFLPPLMFDPTEPTRLPVLPIIREALRKEEKVSILYGGPDGVRTERTVWPLVIAFYHQPSLGAWCEMRKDYRTFRVDRIESATATDLPLPDRRTTLFKAYLEHIFSRTPPPSGEP